LLLFSQLAVTYSIFTYSISLLLLSCKSAPPTTITAHHHHRLLSSKVRPFFSSKIRSAGLQTPAVLLHQPSFVLLCVIFTGDTGYASSSICLASSSSASSSPAILVMLHHLSERMLRSFLLKETVRLNSRLSGFNQSRGIHSRNKKAMEFIAKGWSAMKEVDRVIDYCELNDKRLIPLLR
ncbi:hypothetical protein SOVF_155290 isoform B, partial [Spinacia oleracea]